MALDSGYWESAKDTNVLTKADRIRAMTDEELAEFFSFAGLCSFIQTKDAPFCEARGACDNCLVEWLQQPAEGDA